MARAWRPAVGASLPRTLGRKFTAQSLGALLVYCSAKSTGAGKCTNNEHSRHMRTSKPVQMNRRESSLPRIQMPLSSVGMLSLGKESNCTSIPRDRTPGSFFPERVSTSRASTRLVYLCFQEQLQSHLEAQYTVRSIPEQHHFASCLSFPPLSLASFPPFAPGRLRPNTSLKLTRYGRRRKPGMLCLRHFCMPGLRHLPTRAA